MDQVDADQLLAVPPGGDGQLITPREEDQPQKETVKKWGIDERDKQWLALKRDMQSQKEAHNNRHRTALQFPGVREFVRPYELTNQTNNWDKALDNVTLKIDNIERSHHHANHWQHCAVRTRGPPRWGGGTVVHQEDFLRL
jgi:hypothetical protein